MMRNASCFKTLSHVNNQLRFPKEARKSTPLFYGRVSLISTSKYPNLHTNAHKTANSMAPKSDHMWGETTLTHPIIASFAGHHFYNQPFRVHVIIILPPSLVHQQWSFIIFGFFLPYHPNISLCIETSVPLRLAYTTLTNCRQFQIFVHMSSHK